MDVPPVIHPINCTLEEILYVRTCPCPCGGVGYQILEQGLVPGPSGATVSVIHGRCYACGATNTFGFDTTDGLGKSVPEVPSRVFDLVEWFMLLSRLSPPPTELGKPLNLNDLWYIRLALEQALLFFNPGEDTPRPDAFFHTPDPPEELRPGLTRTFLESVQRLFRERKDALCLRTEDGKLYHPECLPKDAGFSWVAVDTKRADTEPTCAKCGGRLPELEHS